MNEIVVIDDLSFEVRRSARRTTVGLTIDRGGELVLSVPSECPIETARQIAGAKRLWIYTKLAQRERLSGALAAREFVTGASCSCARSASVARSTSSSGMPNTAAPGFSTAWSSLLHGS